MGYFLDAVRFGVSGTPGTAAITVGSAVSGFQLPAAAGVANGQLVPYVIADTGGAWEYGRGTYSSTGPALTRTQIIASSNSGSAISATSAAIVTFTVLAEDMTEVPGVRQTVQYGPGGAAPSFLPATSASLAITSQNVSTSTPLIVSAANGWGLGGQIDALGWTTSNLTWSGLTASQTNYLGVTVNFGVLTSFFTTTAPIYQFGGAISVASGQYTFDSAQMKMFLGNGSVANQVYAVFVGEAVAGASTITSTVAYAYNGYYDSGWVPTLPAATSEISLSANLGTTVAVSEFLIQCLTAENGYNVGDTAVPMNIYANSTIYGAFRWLTRTTAGFTVGAGGFGVTIMNKTTGALVSPTSANWAYRLIVKRSF